ncbi:DUF6284 family protein [Streptomyces phaeofaciens JCM 4814]|uniref:Uncharacterized protein n=1 Tax=Streptomyces phaeofaciens TaxID=68254 RepID=A0A918HJ75_9ACTN|nr:DUF6284 family protein [Streptomyces phaeofaciens]GGT64928.1 hypothetical protein GCM10010226_48480 [Streptomyces phaeofaciens]
MRHIGAVQVVVTADDFDREPTLAELDAIELESPLILAEVDLLDAQIKAMDHPENDVDTRRIRRAHNRVLAARRDAANRTANEVLPGGAA